MTLKKLKLALAVVGTLFSGCAASAEVTSIPEGALIVDVRTNGEFAEGHYPGAINIPLDTVEDRLAEFGDRQGPIIVYCRSGRRSGIAKDILENAGFTKVQNGGGLDQMIKLKPAS